MLEILLEQVVVGQREGIVVEVEKLVVEVGKIAGHQKRIDAKVLKFPFYDPEKSKVKS